MSAGMPRRARLRAITRAPWAPPRMRALGVAACAYALSPPLARECGRGGAACSCMADLPSLALPTRRGEGKDQLRFDAVSVGWAKTSSGHGFDQPYTGPVRLAQTN